MENHRVLLLAGGGTLGTYTASELLKLGYRVDVVCLEPKTSDDPNLTFIQARITDDFLPGFLAENRYDAIVDFIHYPDADLYPPRYRLLMENTRHLIFLSSYRVYADMEHPIRETSPQLLDVATDPDLLANEHYGLSKSKCERILRASPYKHWTIIRPLISFSHFRFDLICTQSSCLLNRAKAHKKILLPIEAKDKVAGFGWAGNIGKMIARLILNEKAYGEAYTLGSGETHTWGDVAQYYTELIGAAFVWVDMQTYYDYATLDGDGDKFNLRYDRLLDRTIDNAKILRDTGLTLADFTCVRDALALELAALPPHPVFAERLNPEQRQIVDAKMDAYIAAHSL